MHKLFIEVYGYVVEMDFNSSETKFWIIDREK